jgi:O-glycosyl hydrolase
MDERQRQSDWRRLLLPSMYDEFAEMCWAYITLLKENYGVDVYALSVQNEPELRVAERGHNTLGISHNH